MTALDPGSLTLISGWIHDADLLVGERRFASSQGTVSLPFEQEPLDATLDLPKAEFLRQTWWAREYRMPYLRCELRVNGATAYEGPWEPLKDFGQLLAVRWSAEDSTVSVDTNFGPYPRAHSAPRRGTRHHRRGVQCPQAPLRPTDPLRLNQRRPAELMTPRHTDVR